MKYCFVVPHFNHVSQFEIFLSKLTAAEFPIYVIDDGSEAEQLHRLRLLVSDREKCRLVELGQNRGKGAAVMVGFTLASTDGFSHAIQIDADGQHNLDDLDKFIEVSESSPTAIVSGRPTFDDDAPKVRVYGRRVTDIWTALETLSLRIEDALCGFRVYPLAEIARVTDAYHIGSRMDFDTDILVKAVWSEVPIRFVDTRVIYVDGGTSHFRYLSDNLRLIGLHVKLIFGMLLRLPVLLWQRWRQFGRRRSL